MNMYNNSHVRSSESGVVSILTVMFFIILVSVLSIGFLRIMTDSQEQTIEDDLTKGALSSASSGVEDAKRALRYCQNVAAISQPACYDALAADRCPGIYASPTLLSGMTNPLTTNLGLNYDGTSVRVGDPSLNQRTTCTLITLNTIDFIGTATGSASSGARMVPLRADGTFNTINLEWHQKSAAVDGPTYVAPTAAAVTTNNPNANSWRTSRYPAMIRIQLVDFQSGRTLDDLSNQHATVFIVPVVSGGTAVYTDWSTNGINPSASTQRTLANCSGVDYACAISLRVPDLPVATGRQYYARISSVYKDTNYRLTLSQNGVPVKFSNVEPQIDVTGAAGDVYRRVISRVSYGVGFQPVNEIESGTSFCKDMFVTRIQATSTCLGL